ncbi:MAG: hypothetical protein IT464_12740 [Planctomycetes bacterium]|nr:hypothetical protein [Planctomycetota bacterium]
MTIAKLTLRQQMIQAMVLGRLDLELPPVIVNAMRKLAPAELKRIHKAFVGETYFNRAGKARPVEPYGDKWRKVKKRRKWSMKRGWATGRLGRTLALRSLIRNTPRGYRLDLSRADKVVRRYTARGNPNSFVSMKAPGLMNMEHGWVERHEEAARRAAAAYVAAAVGDVARVGVGARVVTLRYRAAVEPFVEYMRQANRYGGNVRAWRVAGKVFAYGLAGKGAQRGTRYRKPQRGK